MFHFQSTGAQSVMTLMTRTLMFCLKIIIKEKQMVHATGLKEVVHTNSHQSWDEESKLRDFQRQNISDLVIEPNQTCINIPSD